MAERRENSCASDDATVGGRCNVIAIAAGRSGGSCASIVSSGCTAPAEPPMTTTSRTGAAMSGLRAIGCGRRVLEDDRPQIPAQGDRAPGATPVGLRDRASAGSPRAARHLLVQHGDLLIRLHRLPQRALELLLLALDQAFTREGVSDPAREGE